MKRIYKTAVITTLCLFTILSASCRQKEDKIEVKTENIQISKNPIQVEEKIEVKPEITKIPEEPIQVEEKVKTEADTTQSTEEPVKVEEKVKVETEITQIPEEPVQMENKVTVEPGKTEKDSSGDSSKESEELRAFREKVLEQNAMCGIIYLGYGSDCASYMAESPDWIAYKKTYPFLTEISEEKQIDCVGEEVYCIVPANPDDHLTLYRYAYNEASEDFEAGDILYESEGEPIIVCVNFSDIVPNTELVIEDAKGKKMDYQIFLSLKDGRLSPSIPEEDVYDATCYK